MPAPFGLGCSCRRPWEGVGLDDETASYFSPLVPAGQGDADGCACRRIPVGRASIVQSPRELVVLLTACTMRTCTPGARVARLETSADRTPPASAANCCTLTPGISMDIDTPIRSFGADAADAASAAPRVRASSAPAAAAAVARIMKQQQQQQHIHAKAERLGCCLFFSRCSSAAGTGSLSSCGACCRAEGKRNTRSGFSIVTPLPLASVVGSGDSGRGACSGSGGGACVCACGGSVIASESAAASTLVGPRATFAAPAALPSSLPKSMVELTSRRTAVGTGLKWERGACGTAAVGLPAPSAPPPSGPALSVAPVATARTRRPLRGTFIPSFSKPVQFRRQHTLGRPPRRCALGTIKLMSEGLRPLRSQPGRHETCNNATAPPRLAARARDGTAMPRGLRTRAKRAFSSSARCSFER